MKTNFLIALIVLIVLLLVSGSAVARSRAAEVDAAASTPLSTSFTYQGHLTDGGSPVNGAYDLQFLLYDAASDGAQIGSTVTENDVALSNGLFTVQLDFGAAAFEGAARWLEINVRPGASSGAYTTLSPRQALTPAPYALYSLSTAVHNHLGQTWAGANNPLIIGGSFTGSTATSGAPLILSNTGGDGLRIQQAGTPPGSSNDGSSNGIEVAGAQGRGLYVGQSGDDGVFVAQTGVPVGGSVTSAIPNGFEIARAAGAGVFVGNADADGMRVYQAGEDGVNVRAATANGLLIELVGTPSTTNSSTVADGVEIRGAQGNGLFVGYAGVDGVHVRRAGTPVNTGSTSSSANGVEIVSAQGYAIYISRSDLDGMRIGLAGDDGIDVAGNDFAGYFAGSISVGSCTGCLLAAFAVNAGDRALQPGDIVTVRGMATGAFDNAANLLQVAPASAGLPVVGVVAGWAEVDVKREPREGESGVRLAPREGAAAPGGYVSVIYNGPVQVRAAGAVAVGEKLAVGDDGAARGLRRTEVNGVPVVEDAPVLGIALSEAQDGMVWMLVNPQ